MAAAAGGDWDNRRPFPLNGGSAVVLGTDQGLHGTDDGRTWRTLSGTVNNYLLTGLAVSGQRMVAGVQDFSGFVSHDAGATWVQPVGGNNQGPLGEDGSALFHPSNPNYCYAWTIAGFQYSDDGCHTFRFTSTAALRGYTYAEPGGTQIIAVDPVNASTVYAVAEEGVYRSTNFGVTFYPTGWPAIHATAMAIDPTDSRVIYVCAQPCKVGQNCNLGTGWVYRTEDGGANWTRTETTGVNGYPTTVAISPTNPNVVLIGLSSRPAFGGGMLRSTDRGKTFRAANIGLPTDWRSVGGIAMLSVRFDSTSASPAAALATEYGVFVSMDQGLSWRAIRANAVPLYFSDVAWDSGYLYVSTFGQGVLRMPSQLVTTASSGR